MPNRFFRQSLAIDEKALGQNHPELSVDLNNLGAAYLDQKKLNEAEKSFKQALTLRQKAVGSDHIRLVGIIDNYVKALRGVDRYEEQSSRKNVQPLLEANTKGNAQCSLSSLIDQPRLTYH